MFVLSDGMTEFGGATTLGDLNTTQLPEPDEELEGTGCGLRKTSWVGFVLGVWVGESDLDTPNCEGPLLREEETDDDDELDEEDIGAGIAVVLLLLFVNVKI